MRRRITSRPARWCRRRSRIRTRRGDDDDADPKPDHQGHAWRVERCGRVRPGRRRGPGRPDTATAATGSQRRGALTPAGAPGAAGARGALTAAGAPGAAGARGALTAAGAPGAAGALGGVLDPTQDSSPGP